MKLFFISLFIFSTLVATTVFSSENSGLQKLARKTIIKKPPHGDDGTGGGTGGK